MVANARRQGVRDPLAAQDVRAEAAAKILPALSYVNLHPDAKALLRAYFGLADDCGSLLPDAATLARVPCLARPNHHVAFCERLIWALCDPSAREWVSDDFYK